MSAETVKMLVELLPHARKAAAGAWFVFVGAEGYPDGGFVLVGWN